MRLRGWIGLGAVLVIAGLIAAYIYIHKSFAADPEEVRVVALLPDDPAVSSAGRLKFMGGLDIPRMGQNIGGLSGLRFLPEEGRLLAITDDARWVWVTPIENDGRLTGIRGVQTAPMLDADGEPLTGKQNGDSESLTRSAQGGWLVGFERSHRIARFADTDALAQEVGIDPLAIFGSLEDNGGLETLAGDEEALFLCAERAILAAASHNCAQRSGAGDVSLAAMTPPAEIAELGAVPTDADQTSTGVTYVLLRSYDPVIGNTAGIVRLGPDGRRSDIASLRAPFSVDNFEGLAVREEGDRTFLYIVSDDNFSGGQRTLLMKFEVMAAEPPA